MTDENTQESLLDAPQEIPAEGATAEPATEASRYDFVLDKYRADGRTEQQSLEIQAKSYGELQSKFGSFTGAPDDYELTLSDSITEAGIEVSADDPLLQKAQEFAKAANMSQDGFNNLVNLYVENQLTENLALEQVKAEQFKSLGNNAQSRIDSVNQYIGANFDAETVAAIQGMATSADAIGAIEAMITRGRSVPVAADNAQAAPSVTAADIREMQFALDANGNRRINTDPEFKREFRAKQRALYGDAPAREVIG